MRVVPLYVNFGPESFRDHVDIGSHDFYDRLRAAPALPTTSQPTPQDFVDAFEELRDFERIYALQLSSKLSGTYQSAVAAAEDLGGDRIAVVDTETASLAVGLLALAIQRRLARGTTDEEIGALIERFREENGVVFTVATLEYLQKGGRIGRAQALAGTLLNVKPILSIDDGVVAPDRQGAGAPEGARGVRPRLHVGERRRPGLRLGIAHADAPEWIDVAHGPRGEGAPAGGDRARGESRRRRRHARRARRGRLLLVPGRADGELSPLLPVRRLYSDPVAPALTRDPAAGRASAAWTRRRAGRGRAAPLAPRRSPAASRPCPRVGPAVRRRLAKLGLRTVGDLLAHRPRRYERPIERRSIRDLFGEDEAVIEGIVRARLLPARPRPAQDPHGADRGRHRRDQRDVVQPAVARGAAHSRHERAPAGQAEPLRLPGRELRPRRGDARPPTTHPSTRPARRLRRSSCARSSARRSRSSGRRETRSLHGSPPPRPCRSGPTRSLPCTAPARSTEAEEGRKRLAFDELLVLQLALARRAAEREQLVAEPLPPGGELLQRYRAVLPFTLTEAQERAIAEIDRDLARTTPMQRLLQGDVGSGKTVVALCDAAAGGRGRAAGRPHGADRGPRRAALPHDRGHLHRARRPGRAPHERARRQGARARPPVDRLGRRRRSRSEHTR